MNAPRGEFSSRLGFILAAAGSAVGLGNIWGFPTQAAGNGGSAFLFVYLILAFGLAYPALMAELIIGRHANANAVTALRLISTGRVSRISGTLTGYTGIITASLILSFYSIVGGWMIAYFVSSLLGMVGIESTALWVREFGPGRNILFSLVFMLFTVIIISAGVREGIERWSSRLMPLLLALLVILIIYVLTLEGASAGVRAYLIPDFSRAIDLPLIVNAMGQAFFSLSLGVGTMLIYGSYVNKYENLSALGGYVTLVDVGVAVMAGLLILPAMYVAQANGVTIFDAGGNLLSEDTLIFTVMPALFDTMGSVGLLVSAAFFMLMSIAALTSSISMLEVPVAFAVEHHDWPRRRTTVIAGIIITMISVLIIVNFEALFGFTIRVTTRYSQPLLGFMFCLFAGWIWHRDSLLQEIKQGFEEVGNSLFWKVWPFYIRYICPLAILAVFIQLILS